MQKTIYLFVQNSNFEQWLKNYQCTNVEKIPYDNWNKDEIFIGCTGEEDEMRRLAMDYAQNVGANVQNLFNQIWAGAKVAEL